MPHLMIDYSANLEDAADMPGLCDTLRKVAIDTGVFPLAGVRVRAFAATHVSIADGDPAHGYVDISVRLRAGRASADKARAVDALFEAAKAHLAPVISTRPVAVSLEMRDIDPDLSPKLNTIREYLGKG